MTRSTDTKHFDIIIVGGGIMGLSIAYNLSLRTRKRILVLERHYLCSGASGRNGGGVRAQWSSPLMIQLMRESLELCEDFTSKMGINVWFRKGGYIFFSRNDDKKKSLEASVKLQQSMGLSTQFISLKHAQALVPGIHVPSLDNVEPLFTYKHDDAVVFPWPFVWGYAEKSREQGVTILERAELTAIHEDRACIQLQVELNNALVSYTSDQMILASGVWNKALCQQLEVDLPTTPHRHEICSSEPLKFFLHPLVGDLDNGLYFSQSMRGEIVGGIGNQNVPHGINQENSQEFLSLYSKALTNTMPHIGQVKMLRQWAGLYDLTPDGSPIIGALPNHPHIHLVSGFMGHGFMMAPIIGKIFSEHFLQGSHASIFESWNLDRFSKGTLINESMILG